MSIGAAEYQRQSDSIVVGAEGGGVPAQNQVVVECPVIGALGFRLKNKGDEAVTYEVLARGLLATVTTENVAGLQVGATDQFQGFLANKRITPGTLVITDAGGATQAVQDGGVSVDGIGQIVNAALTTTVVGTINYETGYIDFTWMAAFVGAGVTAAYTHTGWTSFTTPITGTLAAGGGEDTINLRKAPTADNYADGTRGMSLLGIMMYTTGQGSAVMVLADHSGDGTANGTQAGFKLVPPPRFRNLNSPLTQS